MGAFYMTPQIREKRRKMRTQLVILNMKKKIFGKLSEADEKKYKEIMLELSKHY